MGALEDYNGAFWTLLAPLARLGTLELCAMGEEYPSMEYVAKEGPTTQLWWYKIAKPILGIGAGSPPYDVGNWILSASFHSRNHNCRFWVLGRADPD